MHQCPWPRCDREVEGHYWGCPKHWNCLPQPLKTGFIVTQQRGVEVQPVTHQMAAERINNWVKDNYVRLDSEHAAREGLTALQYRARGFPTPSGGDQTQRSVMTPDLDSDFCAGWTPRGEMILFWPRSGEYLVLGPVEVQVLRRVASTPNMR